MDKQKLLEKVLSKLASEGTKITDEDGEVVECKDWDSMIRFLYKTQSKEWLFDITKIEEAAFWKKYLGDE